MGCGNSKNSFNIEVEYGQRNLPQPDPHAYQNEFERHAYITINLLRNDPKLLIPSIKAIKNHKYYKGQAILPLITHL